MVSEMVETEEQRRRRVSRGHADYFRVPGSGRDCVAGGSRPPGTFFAPSRQSFTIVTFAGHA